MSVRLCVDARMISSSGIGTYIRELLPHIAPHFHTTLLLPKMLNSYGDIQANAVIQIRAPIYSVEEQLLLPFAIPSCDLFWTPHYNAPLLPVRAKKRVVTVHDVCHLACKEMFPARKRFFAHFLMQKIVKKADLVLTVSDFSREEILNFFPESTAKVHTVLNGVPRVRLEKNTEQKLFNKVIQTPFFLYVGHIKPHKNIEQLLQAFLLMPFSYDLVLAGKISLPLHRFTHPRIKILGEVDPEALYHLYTNARALIHPSFYEGFGLTCLEAMSLGCPVIASNIGSLVEVCEKAAHYIDPRSIESLCQGIKALENEAYRKELIERGFSRCKLFSWKTAAERILHLFNLELSL